MQSAFYFSIIYQIILGKLHKKRRFFYILHPMTKSHPNVIMKMVENEEVIMIDQLFNSSLSVINIGLESFNDSMLVQNVYSLHLDWKPIAGGDERIITILEKIKE